MAAEIRFSAMPRLTPTLYQSMSEVISAPSTVNSAGLSVWRRNDWSMKLTTLFHLLSGYESAQFYLQSVYSLRPLALVISNGYISGCLLKFIVMLGKRHLYMSYKTAHLTKRWFSALLSHKFVLCFEELWRFLLRGEWIWLRLKLM
jgi:hypothetical protein